jgi:hypothetical protein
MATAGFQEKSGIPLSDAMEIISFEASRCQIEGRNQNTPLYLSFLNHIIGLSRVEGGVLSFLA